MQHLNPPVSLSPLAFPGKLPKPIGDNNTAITCAYKLIFYNKLQDYS
ncbi:MAG: hypothetical protein OQK52_05330 [Ignavibacteriaceae bacterium]|nr:hypothetical protein [Ignavibacteriaceae bacterium]MCW8812751.1 hypothetical protein [Chlorobium sp.]MCW8817281.1 hypothetical protein [Ignavibacteriaceae bacterium]MCW8822673.1 hypothetical protein [Ignavibacteriaceae bacterium]MCW8959945.1 hypothetical protein [Ignavibacteriaceae bacterium]